jgi:hypothetical protein
VLTLKQAPVPGPDAGVRLPKSISTGAALADPAALRSAIAASATALPKRSLLDIAGDAKTNQPTDSTPANYVAKTIPPAECRQFLRICIPLLRSNVRFLDTVLRRASQAIKPRPVAKSGRVGGAGTGEV